MSSKTPTVRQVAWISLIPHFALMGLVFLIYFQLKVAHWEIYGPLTFLFIYFLLRSLFGLDQRKGMKIVKQGDFLGAIPYFEKSYQFFSKYDWIDKYRYITMLSSSKMTYKELSLNNIAFCYGQVGDGIRSKEFYEKLIREFPDNGLGNAALRFINSMNKQ